jgi:hypothetical protein
MRANGYGADLELDGDTLTIHTGKGAAKLTGTTRIAIPLADIERIEYRGANPMVNGAIVIKVRDTSVTAMQAYSVDRPGFHHLTPGTPEAVEYGKHGLINTQSLHVHWRRKDNAAFEQMRDAIRAAIGAHAE